MPGHNGVGVNVVKSHRARSGRRARRGERVECRRKTEKPSAPSPVLFTLPLRARLPAILTRCVFCLEAFHVCRSCFSSPGSLILARTAALPVGV